MYTTVNTHKGTITQEITVTGRVIPAEGVDLGFEQGGRIQRIYVKTGQKVSTGQLLASVSNADTASQVRQAQAGIAVAHAQLAQVEATLESQRAKLDELKKGARQEDVSISEIKVMNALSALNDAQASYEIQTAKAKTDLSDALEGGNAALSKSINVALNSLYVLSDIQFTHFSGTDSTSESIAYAKEKAVFALVGIPNAGRYSTQYITHGTGGAKQDVDASLLTPTQSQVSTAMGTTLSSLRLTLNALNTIPITSTLSASESLSLSTEKSSLSNEIVSLSGKQASLNTEYTNNRDTLLQAETQLRQATNALRTAQAELTLKKAGARNEQLRAQEALVSQAEANVMSQKASIQQAQALAGVYAAQYAKSEIRSPLNGTITKQDAKLGQSVSPNTPLISIMTNAKFHSEAKVPEADIGKLHVGQDTRITLDAYGNEVIFNAKVIAIDPAETLVEGVATYKTTLEFNDNDARIRPGMTSNISIIGESKDNVIIIPQRAVTTKNGEKYVEILEGKKIKEVTVKTGQRGPGGTVEITQGLEDGDTVILRSGVR